MSSTLATSMTLFAAFVLAPAPQPSVAGNAGVAVQPAPVQPQPQPQPQPTFVQPQPVPVQPQPQPQPVVGPAPVGTPSSATAPVVPPARAANLDPGLYAQRARWIRKNQIGFGITLGVGIVLEATALGLNLYRKAVCANAFNASIGDYSEVMRHDDGSCTVYQRYTGQLYRPERSFDPGGTDVITTLVIGAVVTVVGLSGTILFEALRRDPLQRRLTLTPTGATVRF